VQPVADTESGAAGRALTGAALARKAVRAVPGTPHEPLGPEGPARTGGATPQGSDRPPPHPVAALVYGTSGGSG